MSLPGEPTYPTMLPFLPLTYQASTTGVSVSMWSSQPSELDLHLYEGDDVTIPLYFRDPEDPAFDMSDQANWEWFAQIRTFQSPWAPLVAEFICTAEYIPPAGEITFGQTLVTLYLPRQDNWHCGTFSWDLQSLSPNILGPPEGEGEDPTPGVAHTWLRGDVVVESEVTHLPDEWPPWSIGQVTGTSVFLAVTTGSGKTVGPTGQIS